MLNIKKFVLLNFLVHLSVNSFIIIYIIFLYFLNYLILRIGLYLTNTPRRIRHCIILVNDQYCDFEPW